MTQRRPSWWLSFSDPNLPEGEQFLGACIITAPDFGTAVKLAHLLESNPGGEVLGSEIPADTSPFIEDHWRRRILSEAECAELDQHIQEVCSAAARRASEAESDEKAAQMEDDVV